MRPKFMSLTCGTENTVVERRRRDDGTVIEISYPSLDFWVLSFVSGLMKSGAYLTITNTPHKEEDEEES